MSKKVLHIISGDLWGGAEAQVLFQSKALICLGWEVDILLFNKQEPFSRYEKAGLSCHLFPETPGLPICGRKLHSAIKAVSPDIIVAHGYKESFTAAYLGQIFRRPWVATFHGLNEQFRGFAKLKISLYCKLFLWLSRIAASKIVTVSQAMAEQLGFVGLSKLAVVYNAAEMIKFNPETTLSLFKQPALVTVGRLARVKRIDLAIRAIEHIRKLDTAITPHLYVVGEGPQRQELETLAEKLSLKHQIHFLGFRPDAAELIAQARLLVISSDNEGIPTVLLQAISGCVPAVSTAVGGIPEVIRLLPSYPNKLVPAGDPEALAAAILEMIKIRVEAATQTEIKKTYEQCFSPNIAAKRLDQVYRDAIEQYRTRKWGN